MYSEMAVVVCGTWDGKQGLPGLGIGLTTSRFGVLTSYICVCFETKSHSVTQDGIERLPVSLP